MRVRLSDEEGVVVLPLARGEAGSEACRQPDRSGHHHHRGGEVLAVAAAAEFGIEEEEVHQVLVAGRDAGRRRVREARVVLEEVGQCLGALVVVLGAVGDTLGRPRHPSVTRDVSR